MAKVNQLTSAFLKTAPSGKHLDGLGLWYVKRPNGGSQWMLRISLGGKRREMGLGGFPDVSLKEARGLAADYRKMAKQGIDPIKKRCSILKKWHAPQVPSASLWIRCRQS